MAPGDLISEFRRQWDRKLGSR